MQFTDADLHRITRHIDCAHCKEYGHLELTLEELRGFSKRLEAAEDYIGALTTGTGLRTRPLFEEAWRKSKGEGPK